VPKASEVAYELRKLADSLEQEPNARIPKPSIYISTFLEGEPKQLFLTICRLLPRPLAKVYTDRELRVEYDAAALNVLTNIERNKFCRLVEPARPAVYECEPLLSEEEVAAI